ALAQVFLLKEIVMKKFLSGAAAFLLALTVVAAPVSAAAAEAAPDPALNTVPDVAERAELQRLLTQRIAKAYCQAGLGVAPAESGQELLESVVLFDLQVTKLRQSPLSGRERASLAEVEQTWKPLRAAAMRRFTRDGCETVSRQSEELLRVATDLAREIGGRTGAQDAGTLASISVRQRVLAQKLARLYMARAWGLDSVALREEIVSARNEFSGALAKLQEAPENTAAVKERLNQVALQWVWMDTALEQGVYPSYGLVVADSSDAITRDMEAVTRLYRGVPDASPQPIVGRERNRGLPDGLAATDGARRGDAVAILKP
ncbi:MAG TPA: hypothetical protein VF104_09725, partial [Burkholderiales bacterium]